MRQLYVIEYENAHWCGGGLHCVVWAEDENQAEDLASHFMEETQRELYSDEYTDEPDLTDECSYSIIKTELLEGSEYAEYYKDPVQRNNFYPCVN